MTTPKRGTRRWAFVHKWSSLAATLWLLMLCVTGLPLVFHDEIDDALGTYAGLPALVPGQPTATLDQIVASALAAHPGSRVDRSEEHTSELQSLMRISYAVFC